MKSSEKNKVNFGLVNRFKNTKLGKWIVKVKLFFIRSVANSKNPPLCDKSDVIKSNTDLLHKKSLKSMEDLEILNSQFLEYQKKYPFAFLFSIKKEVINNTKNYRIICCYDADKVTP